VLQLILVVCFSSFVGNIFLGGTTLTDAEDVFISLFLIILIVGFVGMFLYQSINIFKKIVQRILAERKVKREERKLLSNKLTLAKKRALQKKKEEAKKQQEEEENEILLEMRDLKVLTAKRLENSKDSKTKDTLVAPTNKDVVFVI
jgi:hypothetical protein